MTGTVRRLPARRVASLPIVTSTYMRSGPVGIPVRDGRTRSRILYIESCCETRVDLGCVAEWYVCRARSLRGAWRDDGGYDIDKRTCTWCRPCSRARSGLAGAGRGPRCACAAQCTGDDRFYIGILARRNVTVPLYYLVPPSGRVTVRLYREIPSHLRSASPRIGTRSTCWAARARRMARCGPRTHRDTHAHRWFHLLVWGSPTMPTRWRCRLPCRRRHRG